MKASEANKLANKVNDVLKEIIPQIENAASKGKYQLDNILINEDGVHALLELKYVLSGHTELRFVGSKEIFNISINWE